MSYVWVRLLYHIVVTEVVIFDGHIIDEPSDGHLGYAEAQKPSQHHFKEI